MNKTKFMLPLAIASLLTFTSQPILAAQESVIPNAVEQNITTKNEDKIQYLPEVNGLPLVDENYQKQIGKYTMPQIQGPKIYPFTKDFKYPKNLEKYEYGIPTVVRLTKAKVQYILPFELQVIQSTFENNDNMPNALTTTFLTNDITSTMAQKLTSIHKLASNQLTKITFDNVNFEPFNGGETQEEDIKLWFGENRENMSKKRYLDLYKENTSSQELPETLGLIDGNLFNFNDYTGDWALLRIKPLTDTNKTPIKSVNSDINNIVSNSKNIIDMFDIFDFDLINKKTLDRHFTIRAFLTSQETNETSIAKLTNVTIPSFHEFEKQNEERISLPEFENNRFVEIYCGKNWKLKNKIDNHDFLIFELNNSENKDTRKIEILKLNNREDKSPLDYTFYNSKKMLNVWLDDNVNNAKNKKFDVNGIFGYFDGNFFGYVVYGKTNELKHANTPYFVQYMKVNNASTFVISRVYYADEELAKIKTFPSKNQYGMLPIKYRQAETTVFETALIEASKITVPQFVFNDHGNFITQTIL